jgi:hypothetical protein
MAHSAPMTTHVRRSLGLPVLLVALLVAGCATADPSPSPGTTPGVAPATPTPAGSADPSASPSSPSSPSASPAAACDPEAPAASGDPSPVAEDPNAALYEEIEAQVTELRGISATQPVDRGVFDQASLCAYLAASFREENPEEVIQGFEDVYKHLLLMPQADSLEALYIELLTSQVAGLYDDETKKMYVVVAEDGEIGPDQQITYAHEYTHALQDQRFVLNDVTGDELDQGDRTFARTTLVEGDATLLMSLWAQQHLTPEQLGQLGASADPAAQATLDRMPAVLKDSLLFPYTGGLQFALAAFQAGGYAEVDALYADPPDTTEQILHPDKFSAREPAKAVTFPADLAATLGEGWTVALQDTMGEFYLEVFARDAAGASDSNDAAEGWGGDRLALLEGPGGASGVVLDTAWDTDADAGEFASALADYAGKLEAEGYAGAVLTPAPDRVVVISASDADALGRIANALGLAG